MRNSFKEELLKQMAKDDNIYLLLGGVGYKFFQPDGRRIINCEASEQTMVDMAVGLALQGKKPIVYCITPHLFRAFEGIRIYLHGHGIPVILVGIGRDRDYGNLGFTHYGEGDVELFSQLDINIHVPKTKRGARKALKEALTNIFPSYINLPR